MIFINFGGNINTIRSLIHELGHAYSNYLLFKNEIFDMECNTIADELAPMFFEMFIWNYVDEIPNEHFQNKTEFKINHVINSIGDSYGKHMFENEICNFKNEKINVNMANEKIDSINLYLYKNCINNKKDIIEKRIFSSHYYLSDQPYYYTYVVNGMLAISLYKMFVNNRIDYKKIQYLFQNLSKKVYSLYLKRWI